jgi:GH25 family lysozyme M1 (1,4-beta-N-acetylmuramidase)
VHHAGPGRSPRRSPQPPCAPRPPRPLRPLLALGGALTSLAALTALTAAPAEATAAPAIADGLAHPELDWLGSTVAAHEGRATSGGDASASSHVTQTPGFDVSNWQGVVDWKAAYDKGARFAYMKATEGTTYRDPQFNANYTNSYKAGFIRGAYHFARPDDSGGKAQADYFLAHGGGWSKDGRTLPPLLDIEYPSGAACYGLSQSAMRRWIAAFSAEVHARTTRWATIYTTTNWWKTCTGDSATFSANHPLFVARYASSIGSLPGGWPFHTFWQHSDAGALPGDQDTFNGPMSGLINLADNI